VIGNSKYTSSPLKNPANDARTMAATLRRIGFEVEEKTDLGYIQLNETVENFGRELKNGGVGLFFYAGHGMQVNGSNYLIPVDMEINDENEVRYKAVDMGLILAKMEQGRANVNIVMLDACRDNPFARSFRSNSRGLATMDAPNSTLIAYATGPGKVASDGGNDENGLFTSELVKVLEQPGLRVEDVFKQVTKAVRLISGNRQIPWITSSLEEDFFFVAKLPDHENERLTREQQRLAEELKKLEEDKHKFKVEKEQARQGILEAENRAKEKEEIAAKTEGQEKVAIRVKEDPARSNEGVPIQKTVSQNSENNNIVDNKVKKKHFIPIPSF
ncbi:MAG: hypothetical protein A2511_14890, partial [Deltaproteobacteria bacterium RIFOXYD12_FULL_50_9]